MKHFKCESENGKVRQENADSIGLNIENDAVRFGIFPFRFHPYMGSVHEMALEPELELELP